MSDGLPEALIFMNASGPLMSCARNDAAAKRFIGAVVMTQGLGNGEDPVDVLGVHRSTLFCNQKLYREGGLQSLRDGRGHGAPRSAHKLTDEVLPIAQACLDRGGSQSAAARAAGVSETAVRHAIKTGRLRRCPRPRTTRRRNDGSEHWSLSGQIRRRTHPAAGEDEARRLFGS